MTLSLLPRVAVRRLSTWPAVASVACTVVASWLAAALNHPLPRGANQLLVLTLAALLAVQLLGTSRRLIGGEVDGLDATQGRWLMALVGLGLVTAFVGLEHEIGGRYFGDEGTFLANAQRMNEGRILRPWFIYPHLLYTLDAIALWVASLFPAATRIVAERVWGVHGELEIAALVTRFVTASFVASTPPVVFHLTRRVAGTPSGLLAGLVSALSTLWLSVGHQSISDVPAAFFAALCLAVCAEMITLPAASPISPRLWVSAGIAAGLAAGSKYPAGLVAVAIVAVWIYQWRVTKRPSWGLIGAGAASMAAFVVATPSLVAYHRQLFAEDGPGLLFGARLYAEAGWAGVIRGSNLRYYTDLLAQSYSPLLLICGAAGLLLLAPTARRPLLWLAPFPAAYFGLILAMRVAVPRNLMPVLPFFAVLCGCGLYALVSRLTAPLGRSRPLTQLAVTLCLLAPLAYDAAAHLTRFARPTTRDVAASWMETNLPKGSLIVKEHYTPVVRYPLFARQPRFVVKLWPDELRQPRHDFVLVASEAYDRYLNPRNLHKKEFVHFAQRYRELFSELPLVREFAPGPWRAGPTIKLFTVDPRPTNYAGEALISAADARVADEAMRNEDGSLEWLHPEGWAVFKTHLAAGRYEVEWLGPRAPERAGLVVTTRLGVPLAATEITEGSSTAILIPDDEKVFATMTAPKGSRIEGLAWKSVSADRE